MKKLKTMVPWHVQRCTSSLTILQAMWSAETRVQVSQCSIFSHACFLWHITEVLAWTIMFPFAVTQLVITTFPLWMTSNGRKVSVCQHSLQDAEGSLWHVCFKVNLFLRGRPAILTTMRQKMYVEDNCDLLSANALGRMTMRDPWNGGRHRAVQLAVCHCVTIGVALVLVFKKGCKVS